MSEELSEFERRLLAHEAKQAAKNPQVPAQPEVDWSDVIPDIETSISEEDQELDEAIKNLSIVDAYNKWCKKSRPDTRSGRQREGIKVSCPNPSHPDKHPTAWLNTDKNLWFCGGCEMGGDIWDIAAWYFGYGVPHYKKDSVAFRELREKIGLELGYQKVKGLMGTYLLAPEVDAPAEPTASVQTEKLATVSVLPGAVTQQQSDEEEVNKLTNAAVIDWQNIVPKNTFLRDWLESTTVDTCPEEYHFWTGLMAIGFAVGRNRTLKDFRPVIPNLFVCLVGPSGAGKSTAKAHLSKIVQDVMPYDFDNPMSEGTKHVNTPGSAEYLVKAFSAPIADPAFPKKIIGHAPVRVQVDFEELSSLVGISGRAGSTMKPTLLEIYDGSETIGSGSLTHGERVGRDPFGQVTSTTQDGSLKKLLTNDDQVSGFMNRWVFVSGRLKRLQSLGGTPVDLKVPAEKLKEIHRWAGTSRSMTMTPDAYTKWDEFFHNVLVPTKDMSERSGSALLNRLDLLYKKLMVLLSCNLLEDEISESVVDQCIALLPYLLRTYGVVSHELSSTDESSINEKVLDAIGKFVAANSKGPTMRELYPTVKKLGTQKVILETIKNMVSLGIINEAPSQSGQRGRPTVRYVVNE